METVIFDGEDGTELEFGILEQTRVGGKMCIRDRFWMTWE